MSENEETPNEENVDSVAEAASEDAEETAKPKSDDLKLNGFYATKEGMSTVYNDKGEAVVVTVLKCQPWFVSQVKTVEKDGYEAVQIASTPKKAKNSKKAEVGRVKRAGFENGARFVLEVRQNLPEGVQVGQKVTLESFEKGENIKIVGRSKGRGFSGVMKRWDFGGGPASHGSGFHRKPGSIGNRTWPGRVMPGRKMSGHFGDERITVPNSQIVEVLPEDSVLLVKGPVPGARNSLVKLMKV